MTAFCAFHGCDNPPSPKATKGLCNSHYWQLHKGRPLTPLSYRRNVLLPWIEAHASHEGSDCLIWPFGRHQDGRAGSVKVGGKSVMAARVMCEMAHGKPPSAEHEAAHSCGKGHLGCINPTHLRWATPIENKADMIEHGTRICGEKHWNAKLTERTVFAIREFSHTMSEPAIASLFGIETYDVTRIIRGERWGHV
jgi:hypothetical protein